MHLCTMNGFLTGSDTGSNQQPYKLHPTQAVLELISVSITDLNTAAGSGISFHPAPIGMRHARLLPDMQAPHNHCY